MTLTSEVALTMLIDLAAGRRDDGAHRLGEHDAAQGAARAHAEGRAGLALAGVDGEQAAADDLGHVRGLVEAEAEDGREQRA